MIAIILAGGRDRGELLRPLAYPAHLLPVANRSLIEHQLAWLARERVKMAVVAVDHRGASLASPPPAGLDVRMWYSPGPMGMTRALGLARSAAPDDDRVLLVDGSLLTLVDLDPLITAHERSGTAITWAAPNASGRRHPLRRPRPSATEGICLVQYDAMARLGATRDATVHGYWRELRTPEGYLAAHLEALGGSLGSLPGREVASGVFAEGAAHILSSAAVAGPVLIGSGSVIGERATVSETVIGSSCIIAAEARVERSVLLDGARIGRGAVITDSIIGPCAHLAGGTSVSGVSLVGPGARIASGEQLVHSSVA